MNPSPPKKPKIVAAIEFDLVCVMVLTVISSLQL